jgi:hypothetical protein
VTEVLHLAATSPLSKKKKIEAHNIDAAPK